MVDKTSRTIAIIVLLLGLIVLSVRTQAQNVVRKGNTFIEQSDSSKKSGATKTQYLYTDSKGVTDTVYISSKGHAFVWKVSKKTGNKYRKYIPEVTRQISKTIKK